MANDFRFQLRGGASVPGDDALKERELGYCENGIIYSKNHNGSLKIIAQELNYGTALPVTGSVGQIFYALEEEPYFDLDVQNAEDSSF